MAMRKDVKVSLLLLVHGICALLLLHVHHRNEMRRFKFES